MNTLESLLKEFDQEAENTRKMLALIPEDQYSWRPHKKSMSLQQLATHVAEIPGWVAKVLITSELDFSTDVSPKLVESNSELIHFFDQSYLAGRSELARATETDLLPDWTMRNGDMVISVDSKADVIRMCFSQTVHHRAQLGVYLRLLNIPIPGSYGPSADEMEQHANYAAAS